MKLLTMVLLGLSLAQANTTFTQEKIKPTCEKAIIVSVKQAIAYAEQTGSYKAMIIADNRAAKICGPIKT